MQLALQLALEGCGTTSPNPSVGSVIVNGGTVVGQGRTQPAGQSHAEIAAIEMAGEKTVGATMYVTLEPCCHYGRTPPCTDAIIAAKISRVKIATLDPNPQVSGNGIKALEEAGISVEVDDSVDTIELYEGFAKHIVTNLPFVIAKFATSLDGKISTNSGDSKWITGSESRAVVHEMRRTCDAVIVGVNTIIADDPQLTARDQNGQALNQQPLKVIIDTHARTPTTSRFLSEPGEALLFCSENVSSERVSEIKQSGANVIPTKQSQEGLIHLPSVMEHLGRIGVVKVIIEGGGTILGSFFDNGLIDKVYAFSAPIIIGGMNAPSPVEGIGVQRMNEVYELRNIKYSQMGNDWMTVGYPIRRS
ncbi:MAG: riboflavin biosynthesis protein RibD [Dehalococcoidia bacterium]|nr:riboflavin biosynthesis protein RibD [Dehalococcoidia bacterium]